MRFSEVLNLRRSHFRFKGAFIKVFIQKSKTEVYRKNNWLYISFFKSICPIQQLKSCLDMLKINKNSNEYIFRDISTEKVSKWKGNVPMSYAPIQENFIQF